MPRRNEQAAATVTTASKDMATKALRLQETPTMVPTLFSIIHMSRPGQESSTTSSEHLATTSMCMSQLFDTLSSVEDSSSEAFPSIEWPSDHDDDDDEDQLHPQHEQSCSGHTRHDKQADGFQYDNDGYATAQHVPYDYTTTASTTAPGTPNSKRRRSYDGLQDAMRRRCLVNNMSALFRFTEPPDQGYHHWTLNQQPLVSTCFGRKSAAARAPLDDSIDATCSNGVREN